VGPVPVRSATRAASSCAEQLTALGRRQVAQLGVRDEGDVAAATAVAAVRPALRHVRLAAKAQRAVTAATRLDADARAVVEHGAPRATSVADRDEAAVAAGAEVDLPVPDGEDRVVATDLRARPGPEPAAALADQDHPGLDVLTGEDLHAQSLRVRVAPVARGTKTLLVRHLAVLLLVRERRLERGDRALTRAVLLLVLQSGLEHGPPP